MEIVGTRILRFYGAERKWDSMKRLFERYDAWAVGDRGVHPHSL